MEDFFKNLSKILPVSLNGVSATEYKAQQGEIVEKKKNPLDFDGMGHSFANLVSDLYGNSKTNNAVMGTMGPDSN